MWTEHVAEEIWVLGYDSKPNEVNCYKDFRGLCNRIRTRDLSLTHHVTLSSHLTCVHLYNGDNDTHLSVKNISVSTDEKIYINGKYYY